ncbi:MAG: 4Fe-4S ferredoxin [Acidobacteriota bacterium]|nr:MAG: 4Fe-4S ferredoxin [Acidobacteriota bacterium]
MNPVTEIERQSFDVDIVCVGFGPAAGGFLTTLSRELLNEDGTPRYESKVMPGMPLQISCYERADDIAFGVSGVATRARGIRESLPEFNHNDISMAAPIKHEKVLYLLDPIGASRRPASLKVADRLLGLLKWLPFYERDAFELPYIPPFLRKDGGYVLSIGQFLQWVGSNLMGSGTVTIWPGTPVASPLIEDDVVRGVRLIDQGVEKDGTPTAGFMPGMDVRAALTVVSDGPVGAVGRQLDEHFGLPEGNHQSEWAVGAKMVVDLREDVKLEPGTIFHSMGYPEPEIFGFMYAHSEQTVSVGIFVPSWFNNPARTSYRYLQHFMMHPYFWKYLEGGKLRSWGAKSLQESGKRGEPFLVGDGYARVGEGSGSTNVLSGSGVDEAWTTGRILAESVMEMLDQGESFTRENLEKRYVQRRRASWVEQEGRVAEKSRDGFQKSFVKGLMGMALSGFSNGRINISGNSHSGRQELPSAEAYYQGKIPAEEVRKIREDCKSRGTPSHDPLMDRAGWPQIPLDGQLLVSQQDALLMGGKVQAAPGYADHVVFLHPEFCESCGDKVCVDICSGQAIEADPDSGVRFDREKCVHCGACFWNCDQIVDDSGRTNIEFRAGAGGLHSAEN